MDVVLLILHEGVRDGYTSVDRGPEAGAQVDAFSRESELLREALLDVRELVLRLLVGHDLPCPRVVEPGVVERGEAVEFAGTDREGQMGFDIAACADERGDRLAGAWIGRENLQVLDAVELHLQAAVVVEGERDGACVGILVAQGHDGRTGVLRVEGLELPVEGRLARFLREERHDDVRLALLRAGERVVVRLGPLRDERGDLVASRLEVAREDNVADLQRSGHARQVLREHGVLPVAIGDLPAFCADGPVDHRGDVLAGRGVDVHLRVDDFRTDEVVVDSAEGVRAGGLAAHRRSEELVVGAKRFGPARLDEVADDLARSELHFVEIPLESRNYVDLIVGDAHHGVRGYLQLPELVPPTDAHDAGLIHHGLGESFLVEVLVEDHRVDRAELLRVLGIHRGLDLPDAGGTALGEKQESGEIARRGYFIGVDPPRAHAGGGGEPDLGGDELVQRLVDREAGRGGGKAFHGGHIGGQGVAHHGGDRAGREALAAELRKEDLAGGQDGGVAVGGPLELGDVRKDFLGLLLDIGGGAHLAVAADEQAVHHAAPREDVEGVLVRADGLHRLFDESVHVRLRYDRRAGSAVLVVLVHIAVGSIRAGLGGGELRIEVRDERVDRLLHGEDAARREGLALVVVGEQHRLLHALRDLRLAAEQVGDGLLEEIARAVVHHPLVDVARPLVDGVGLRLVDGQDLASVKRLGDAGADDRLPVAGVEALLGEIHEGLEMDAVEIDRHGVSSVKVEGRFVQWDYTRRGGRLRRRG